MLDFNIKIKTEDIKNNQDARSPSLFLKNSFSNLNIKSKNPLGLHLYLTNKPLKEIQKIKNF
ncbi:hypothetical protein BpHYR1_013092 [Brachionus plicatilis]|uniref:Uncharacterized protein n=1 Tax=Brachionus plicatilis TaxID=10195 RepID=A0A3M7R0J4_BRAPC|nr:hypothetical protein BpHYR1_013092 [Brachionus plicatilis]